MSTRICALCFFITICHNLFSQSFPSPQETSTGQGTIGTIDPNWTTSKWFLSNPPNPIGLDYYPTLINNNCAPGAWMNPTLLPYPLNTANWITGIGTDCEQNDSVAYKYFRLTLNLPELCAGKSVLDSGAYVLHFSAYVDNQINEVYLNGEAQGVLGGSFGNGNQLNFSLYGPWNVGINYIDFLLFNLPEDLNDNPYGLFVVIDPELSADSDLDGDLVNDLNDFCPCRAGTLENGCNPEITDSSIICRGESVQLEVNDYGDYLWSTGETTRQINVIPEVTTTYTCQITKNDNSVNTLSTVVYVNYVDIETIEIPNIITPNNDGNNDYLDLNSFFKTCIDFQFTIVNRWGNLVFQQIDPSQRFTGTDMNDTMLNEGVYFYEIRHSNGVKNGFIQIFR